MRRTLLLDTTRPTPGATGPPSRTTAPDATSSVPTTTRPSNAAPTTAMPTMERPALVGPAAEDLVRAQEDRAFEDLVAGLAPCRWNDPELWFAEQAERVEEAKALCRGCPLVRSCLAGAVERAEPWGVWGGEVFVDGVVVARKRGRGRPRKSESP